MQPQADPFIVPHCADQIEILYQDSQLLLINKPSKLLSLSGKHPLNQDSVHYRLVQQFPTATLAHRLDFGTSGIMIVALNKAVNAELTKQFQQRTIDKRYIALLHGQPAVDEGVIDLPIAKDRDNFPLQKICHDSGKAAQSHFRVIERLAEVNNCRVEFTPLTGRTHQLRIHSRELGHPILGCDLYASNEAFFKAQRLMLHASRICFVHPVSGEPVDARCECPF
ncbi:MAG: pseudouridine synthase [Motiliproteus sp.]